MKTNLLPHNQKTFEEILEFISRKENCCVTNDCGTGKSFIMAALLEKFNNNSFLIITRQSNAKNYFENISEFFKSKNVTIITYTKLCYDFKKGNIENYNKDFYLFDEAHYMGANLFSISINNLIDKFKPIYIGFTATPQRYEDQFTNENIITKFFQNHSVGNITSKELMDKGLMVQPEYYLSIWDYENEASNLINEIKLYNDLDENKKLELITKINKLVDVWNNNDTPEKVLKKLLPKYLKKNKTNRILIYVESNEDLKIKQELFNKFFEINFSNEKIKSYQYTSKNINCENDLEDFIKDDDNYIKILYNINKVTETIHFENLNIVIMLRRSNSLRLITQQFGRLNSLKNKEKTLIIDMVDNLNNLIKIKNKKINSKYSSILDLETKKDKENNYKIRINESSLNNLRNYLGIFDITSNFIKFYEYKNVIGNIKNLAFVFCRDEKELKELISKGIGIEEAMDLTKMVPIKYSWIDPKFNIDFEISEKAIKLCNSKISVYNNFIIKRNITDEDLKSILYLQYCKGIHKSINNLKLLNITSWELMQRTYLIYMRHLYIKEILFTNIDNVDGIYTINNYIDNKFLRKDLIELCNTLTPKEQKVIELYFGFDDKSFYNDSHSLYEVGVILNRSPERIRQILAKALRKSRHPSRSEKIKGFLESI